MRAPIVERDVSGGAFGAAASRFVALAAACAALAACATAAPAPAPAEAELRVERVYMFMRHGVRTPTRAVVLPPGYTDQPWPEWETPPGHLTARGYQGAVLVGAWTHEMLAARGLDWRGACPEAHEIRVYTNTIQRTRETGRGFLEGFAPDCAIASEHAPGDRNDPMFDAIDVGATPWAPAAARAAIEAQAGGSLDGAVAPLRPAFDRLSEILGCCAPPVCEANTLAAGCGFGDLPHVWEDTPENRRVRFLGPFSQGGTAVQSLLLAYLDNAPPALAGWGRASAADHELLSQIHAREFDILSRTPYVSRRAAAFILDDVMAMLSGNAAPKFTLLIGHDTNIANLAGVLDLHWHVPGYAPDDQAVTGAIGWELLSAPGGARFVRIFYQAPGVEQVRALTPLNAENPPYFAYLEQPNCGLPHDRTLCRLEDFLHTTDALLIRRE